MRRTWLAPDGKGKADVETQRRAMGRPLGNAVGLRLRFNTFNLQLHGIGPKHFVDAPSFPHGADHEQVPTHYAERASRQGEAPVVSQRGDLH